jgi:hypothetical protein
MPMSMLLSSRKARNALSAFSYSANAKSCIKTMRNEKQEAKHLGMINLESSCVRILSTLQRKKLMEGSARNYKKERSGSREIRTFPQRESILLMRLLSASEGMPLTNTTVLTPSFGSAIIP